jgi:Cd2+/Zn2+-exporting ATPase
MIIKDFTELTGGPSCDCNHHDHSHPSHQLFTCLLGVVFIVNTYLLEFFTSHLFASQLCAIVAALIFGLPILWTAIKDLIGGKLYMNELVALALLASFVQEDFKTAGLIGFFMLLSLIIEQKSAVGARASIEALVKLTPQTARLVLADGTTKEVKALDLQVGDVVSVRPGENFPADGMVLTGATTVNQASITGESLPVDKLVGEALFAGTENLTGAVTVEVSRVGNDTTLGKVRDMIQQAEHSKTPVMRLIDHYIGLYTPTVLMISALVWFFTHDMDRVISVLVVACPCAIVLATPSATIAALAIAAKFGLLFRDVSHLELAATIDTVVFDKTGTLTKGNLAASVLHPMDGVEPIELMSVAVQAEVVSNHPVADAIRKLALEAKIEWDGQAAGEEVSGRGCEVRLGDSVLRAGRVSWLKELGLNTKAVEESLKSKGAQGYSLVVIARNQQVLGWIGLSDEIRENCKEMISTLKAMKIKRICMVTGDNESVAWQVASKVGIDVVEAGCLPEDKVAFVEKLLKTGARVAVIGDGVNDAPALASGTTGIAMGATGSDIAVNSAAIALMNTDLTRLPFILKLSKKTSAVMNQNLSAGLLFIVGGLYLSAMGILSPVVAAVIHTMSSLFIIFNSARLIRLR